MDNVFLFLHASAMCGTAYVGYQHGIYIKKLINSPSIQPYKNKIGFKSHYFFNEDLCCNLTGLFTGILIGRMLWPIALPLSAFYIERIHGDQIRKFIKDLK